MAIELSIRYEDDTANPVATLTACHIEVTGLDLNVAQDAEGISGEVPADPITYYLTADHATADSLVSPRFGGPAYSWDGVVFPEDGAWTINVRLDSDDSSEDDLAVTVDAA